MNRYMTTFKERLNYWSYFVGQNVYYNITFIYLGYKLNDKDVQIMAKCNSGAITREEAEALLSRKY